MQRYRSPAQLFQKSITRGPKGIEEFNEFLKYLITQIQKPNQSQNRIQQILVILDSLISYFLAQAKTYMLNQLHRNNLVQCLQNFGFSLDQIRQVNKYYQPIMHSLLSFFTDASEKVRLSAIGGIYNLLNKFSENGKEFFLLTFERVSVLIADDSGQIRQAATFLNQALKTMVNDAVFDQNKFNLRQFVEKLAQRLQQGGFSAKQFMLDWLMAIEQVPQFEISFQLPLFFRQVFNLLLSPSKSLRTKAEECLKKFMHVFRETLALEGKLSSKIRNDSAQVIIEMALILVRENLSSEINFHALEWLQLFTRFFSHQITQSKQIFLEPIYSVMLRDIILVVVTTLSDESDKIRKISSRINQKLLQVFPLMEIHKKSIDKASQLLQALLSQSRVPLRVQAILRWVKLLLQNNSQRLLTEINRLIQLVVQKLCDRNATRTLFQLLEGSIFVEDYYGLLVQTLLKYLCLHNGVPPEPIFRQLLALSDAQNHFIQLCKCVKKFEDKVFRYRFIQSLIAVLVSQQSLQHLRTKLTQKQDYELFADLFSIFSRNEAATLILCFLAGKYYLARSFLQFLAKQELLTDYKFRSLVKMSNLVEHSNMNHLRTDLRQSATAVKAYLSLLMALPYGKYSGLLLQRLPPQMPPLKQEQILQEQIWLADKLLQQYRTMREKIEARTQQTQN